MIFWCTNTENFIQHQSRLIPRRADSAEMPQNIQPQKIAIRDISKTIHTKYSITYNPPWVVYIMQNSTDKGLPTLLIVDCFKTQYSSAISSTSNSIDKLLVGCGIYKHSRIHNDINTTATLQKRLCNRGRGLGSHTVREAELLLPTLNDHLIWRICLLEAWTALQ